MEPLWKEQDYVCCSGSKRFAKEMAAASPFADLDHALQSARDIWFNKIDVNGWLEAFAAHPAIGAASPSISQWSKEEQSTALATATDSTVLELVEWNARYREKFGFVFLICASGRGTPEILAELKKRYLNRPIVEFEIAAQEEMKIIELRLAKLFKTQARTTPSVTAQLPAGQSDKAGDRIGIIGAHLTAVAKASAHKSPEISGNSRRSRPPITTHVLDVARGSPASGMEIHLEMWKDTLRCPSFTDRDSSKWMSVGSSVTNTDGRSGPLMDIVDYITPGFYRISFNTGKYVPSGFFPYVSIAFEVRENQRSEHFHVPLLYSPFSFTTYRGS
ncbi:uric acid degradation bifunctional protein TTL-like isoform X1 [Phoenix dactylifera]|uniref:Uric acid degradation bifunctional protein TTL-like isoform X1 n=1 Tax=Phoenix dactylifera TaxID=42345 RepID=A0A8B7CCQ9_PHODC|nr:uric acid degradation bifunctional protein TTL-like isoform X1 [Phoenix dactylifera]